MFSCLSCFNDGQAEKKREGLNQIYQARARKTWGRLYYCDNSIQFRQWNIHSDSCGSHVAIIVTCGRQRRGGELGAEVAGREGRSSLGCVMTREPMR